MTRISTSAMAGREAVVRDWVRRRLGAVDHELRVARVAGSLMDITQDWHGMGGAERRLLLLGALLHDVGRSVEEKGHAKHGARMILESSALPLGETERRRLAYLTRYHRGRVPAEGAEEILDHRDDRRRMRVLLGLLRAADGLDSRSMPAPRLLLMLHERRLTVQGYVEGDAASAAAVLGRPKKFQLLQDLLDCEIRTIWRSTHALALVA